MKKLKYALIGCGRISPNHIAACLDNKENLEIVAVSDIISEKMEDVLQKVIDSSEFAKNIRKYTDYKEMLKVEKIDLIAIATESGSHAAIAMDCIHKGCHVMIEKPIALSIKDADDLIKAAKDKNVLLCACHQNRFNKSITKIRQSLDAEKFGKLLHATAHVRWNRGQDYYAQASWRGTWAQDGGALMNQCIHNIDLLRWLLGEDIDEVFGYIDNLKHPFIEGEDLGMALIKFKNGAYAIIEGTTNVYPKNLEETLYIFGQKGTVKVGGKSVNRIEEWMFENDIENVDAVKANHSENPPNIYGFGHSPLYADMISAIKEGRKPYVDGEAGKKALELVLAIYKSALEGKPVKFPITDFSTMDMMGSLKKCEV